jgi:hypothetical protein
MRAARIDANHGAVVAALRAIGASVCSLARLGDGCPDLLVGLDGVNVLLEVKDGAKPPSARGLTVREQEFIATWRGSIHVVVSPRDAVAVVTRATRRTT